jgi:hypothetical protein
MPLMVLACSACNFPASQVRTARSLRRLAHLIMHAVSQAFAGIIRSKGIRDVAVRFGLIVAATFLCLRFAVVFSVLGPSLLLRASTNSSHTIAAQASIVAALAYVWSEIAIGSFYHIFWEISGLSFDAQTSKKAYAYINFGSTAATLFIGLVGVLTPAVCTRTGRSCHRVRSHGCVSEQYNLACAGSRRKHSRKPGDPCRGMPPTRCASKLPAFSSPPHLHAVACYDVSSCESLHCVRQGSV